MRPRNSHWMSPRIERQSRSARNRYTRRMNRVTPRLYRTPCSPARMFGGGNDGDDGDDEPESPPRKRHRTAPAALEYSNPEPSHSLDFDSDEEEEGSVMEGLDTPSREYLEDTPPYRADNDVWGVEMAEASDDPGSIVDGLTPMWIPDKLILVIQLRHVVFDFTLDNVKAYYVKHARELNGLWAIRRPGAKDFFSVLEPYYEFVATIDREKAIADKILSIIDPDSQIFKGRMFCQPNFLTLHKDPLGVARYFDESIRDRVIGLDIQNPNASPICRRVLHVLPYKVFYSSKEAFRPNKHSSICKLARHESKRFIRDQHERNVRYLSKNALDDLLKIHVDTFENDNDFNVAVLESAFNTVSEDALDNINRLKPVEPQPKFQSVETTLKQIQELTPEYLINNKKLVLLVDLDNTVMEATKDDVPKYILPDHFHDLISSHCMKVRPRATQFLAACAQKYEMIVVTNAGRRYAERVVQVIDPDNTLFKERIVSTSDMTKKLGLRSQLKLGVLREFRFETRPFVTALDDRSDVWKTLPMLRLQKYQFFRYDDQAFTKNRGFYSIGYPMTMATVQEDGDEGLMDVWMNRLEPLHEMVYRTRPIAIEQMWATVKAWWEESEGIDYDLDYRKDDDYADPDRDIEPTFKYYGESTVDQAIAEEESALRKDIDEGYYG